MPTKLGQNFLNNKTIVDRIIIAGKLNSDDLVLEIGPGQGVLTTEIAPRVRKIITVEIDSSLIPFLQEKFSAQRNIQIINADILKINLPELCRENEMTDFNYKLIANIPYYITAKIIRLFLESATPPKEMLLMIQKEVAERIVAPAGKMSKLAVAVQYYAQPKILFSVSKENFTPAPKVDSAVIKIENIKKIPAPESKKFFQAVRAGFASRRKTLANNLSNSLHLPKNEILSLLKSIQLSPSARAQELSIEDWKKLSQNLQPLLTEISRNKPTGY